MEPDDTDAAIVGGIIIITELMELIVRSRQTSQLPNSHSCVFSSYERLLVWCALLLLPRYLQVKMLLKMTKHAIFAGFLEEVTALYNSVLPVTLPSVPPD